MNRSLPATAHAVALLGTLAAGCGDDTVDAGGGSTVDHDHECHDPEGHDPEVVIEGIDDAFDGVPASVPAGTTLGFHNSEETELHELVGLAPAELEGVLGAPVTVMLHPPGAPEPIVAVGDGTLVEPGRYALLCLIPTGADPGRYMAAVEASGGEKPEGVDGRPPHFAAGMFAELTVE